MSIIVLKLPEVKVGGFEAVGYTKRYLCCQPQPKMAIPGGVIAWVDATNIKINPSENALLVGLYKCLTATSGGSSP